MSENSKYAMSLTYGPREELLLKELDNLGKEKKLPKSKNEILRRGLHACRYLSETNEKRLLFSLHKILKSLSKEFDRTTLQFAEDISFSILSIITVKYGLSKADTFQTIPMNLRMFNQVLDEGIERKQVEEGMKLNIGKLADSIETIFLSPSEMTKYEVESMDKIIKIVKDNFYEKLVGRQKEVHGTQVHFKGARIVGKGNVRIVGSVAKKDNWRIGKKYTKNNTKKTYQEV